MSTRGKSLIRAAGALALGLMLVIPAACEGDNGGNGGNGGGTDVNGGGNTDVQLTDVGEVQRTLFRATVKDFQTRIAHADAECWLLFNSYPEDYAQFSDDADLVFTRVPQAAMDAITGGGYTNPLTSGEGGTLEIMLPAGSRWGWECDKGQGDTYRKTYQFNIGADSANFEDEEVWIIPNGLYNLAPQLAEIELDPELGVVAGRLVWDNAQGEEEYVGCGVVSMDPATPDVAYFGGNDLPVPRTVRTESLPANGLFIGANMPEGPVEMTATVGDTIIGREIIFSEAQAVVISNIHAGQGPPGDTEVQPVTSNPTPASCQ